MSPTFNSRRRLATPTKSACSARPDGLPNDPNNLGFPHLSFPRRRESRSNEGLARWISAFAGMTASLGERPRHEISILSQGLVRP